MTLSLKLPADFPVGRYQMVAEVVPQGSRKGETKDCGKEIVVLFNPWAQGMLFWVYTTHMIFILFPAVP